MSSTFLSYLFRHQTKTITGAALILSASAFISRLLGLFRDRLLAGNFGAGTELDIYFAAFRLPDFIYNILIAGGIIVAFLPLFSEYFLKDKEDAWQFVNNIINIFLVLLVGLSVIIFFFAPLIIKIITPGFDPNQMRETVFLTRILLLSPIFLGLSSIFSGILQYFNRFLIYGFSPVLYNVGIILGIIFFAPSFGVLGVGFGVIIGAFMHLAFQIPFAVKSGFSYRPTFNFKDPKIKRVFSLLLPRTLGVAAPQINLIVITAIASVLPAGALTIFSLANNLQQFPLGLFGIPFAVAAFPALSKAFASFERQEFIKHFYSTFRKILYIVLPLSFLVFLLRNQIVEIIYKSGKFGQGSVQLTAACLGLFALGFWASALMPLLLRGFFALYDTKTPTVIAIFALILNVFLSFTFVWLLSFSNFFSDFIVNILSLQKLNNIAVVGLPLAFSIDVIFQFALLMFLLAKKINRKFASV